MGHVYWFDRWERQTIIVHEHMVEDGPFEDPRMAGRIHGIGIRESSISTTVESSDGAVVGRFAKDYAGCPTESAEVSINSSPGTVTTSITFSEGQSSGQRIIVLTFSMNLVFNYDYDGDDIFDCR